MKPYEKTLDPARDRERRSTAGFARWFVEATATAASDARPKDRILPVWKNRRKGSVKSRYPAVAATLLGDD